MECWWKTKKAFLQRASSGKKREQRDHYGLPGKRRKGHGAGGTASFLWDTTLRKGYVVDPQSR